MKLIVCVKQVPDTSGVVAVKEDGTMDRSAMPAITNPDDLSAVELALQIKEQTGCQVFVVSMGPPIAEEMLRELLAMGADEAYLICGREFGGSDTYATSQILAAGIHHIGLDPDDIILCGRQAIDGDTAQVGPQIAEKLNLPQMTYAAQVTVTEDGVVVNRLLEDGYMVLKAERPCLLTCVKEVAIPRYMSVSGILECYSKPLTVLDYDALKDEPLIDDDTIGLKGSPTNVYKSFSPPKQASGIMLEGTPQKVAADLASILHENNLI